MGDTITLLRRKIERLQVRAQQAEARVGEYEEREASCCPEDVGFVEFIAALQARAEKAEAEMVVLRADLARAVEEKDANAAEVVRLDQDLARVTEERDAALVLLKTLGAEHGRAWLSPLDEAAFSLLRERGLLGGER